MKVKLKACSYGSTVNALHNSHLLSVCIWSYPLSHAQMFYHCLCGFLYVWLFDCSLHFFMFHHTQLQLINLHSLHATYVEKCTTLSCAWCQVSRSSYLGLRIKMAEILYRDSTIIRLQLYVQIVYKFAFVITLLSTVKKKIKKICFLWL